MSLCQALTSIAFRICVSLGTRGTPKVLQDQACCSSLVFCKRAGWGTSKVSCNATFQIRDLMPADALPISALSRPLSLRAKPSSARLLRHFKIL